MISVYLLLDYKFSPFTKVFPFYKSFLLLQKFSPFTKVFSLLQKFSPFLHYLFTLIFMLWLLPFLVAFTT